MSRRGGFTLAELLVVVFVIAVVLSLLLPSLSRSKARAQSVVCLGNLRQVQMAWTLYADDHDGWLPGVIGGSLPGPGRWVSGWMDFSTNPDNTNTLYLTAPEFAQVGPYVRTPSLFRCPADRSTVQINGRTHARVRSISMNCWMNYVGTAAIVEGLEEYRIFRKLDDITVPPPQKAWVLMDEWEESINDGLFAVNPKRRGWQARIVDFPSGNHSRGAGVVFADGHTEMKRWVDRRTTPSLRTRETLDMQGVPSPDNKDVAWLQERSTSLKTALE